MIIKKYNCKRFAGIKDKDIEFKDGLNVIVGSNEAGKSTLVEGIHSVLFKSSKVGFKSADDKEFRSKFMPIHGGDSIDGEVILKTTNGEYRLSKEWGNDPSTELMTPSSEILKNEENIDNYLKDILTFGEGTYSSIFFSKQIHIKEAIEKIISNNEATSEISSLLRRAIMELDGVSLDKLEKKINTEIDDLLKRWDMDKNYPENNRGISNPYKTGYGQICASFYRKETIRLEMDKANEAEKRFNEICDKLKGVEASISEYKNKKELMEKLESDVINRSILEPKILQYDREVTNLSKINQEWPQNELRLRQLKEELSKLENDCIKLEAEKEQVKKVLERKVLLTNLDKIDNLKNSITDITNEIATVKAVTKEDIKELENNYNNMRTTEAMLKAGVIIGQLNYFNGDADIVVTKDLDEPIKVKAGEDFTANGYMKIECDGLFELELKSGDMDFKELRSQYDTYKSIFESLLNKLGVVSLEEAKLNKEKLENLHKNIDFYNNQIDSFLGDNTYESLRKKVDSYGDINSVRNIECIEAEMKAVANRKIEVISDVRVLESNIEKWSTEYENIDGLFDKIISIKMEQKEVRTQLKKLTPLPEEYNSTDDFRDTLTRIRAKYEEYQESISSLKDIYHECEKALLNSTFEELSKEYISEENLFNKKLAKAKKLLKIKEAFEDTRKKMDEASFTPLIKAFSNYISLLTNGNYKTTDIDKDFNVKLEKDNRAIIPLSLLSSGTYDSVALALRLSILEYILGDNKGFLILDDCLVDLDPYRREMAIKLINEFSSKHQVIFTTCSPDTAKQLGGYLIQM
jgi:exonuclease SbcC